MSRITTDPDILAGSPCIRGMRIPVSVITAYLTEGASDEEILAHYPDLEPADLDAVRKWIGRPETT